MYSQCPECLARFRVGAGDLRAAGGTVRCGRCGSAFNALARLSDTPPPALGGVIMGRKPDEIEELAAHDESVAGVEFHFTASDIESVFVDPTEWADRRRPTEQAPEFGEPVDFAADPPIIVDTESRPFEDITLEGEGLSIESILGIDADKYDALVDDNSPTDEFEILRDVPDSAYPDVDEHHAPAPGGVPAVEMEDVFAAEPDEVYAAEPVEVSATEPDGIEEEVVPAATGARAVRIGPWDTGAASPKTAGDGAFRIDPAPAAEDVLVTRRPVITNRGPDSETSLTAVLERRHIPEQPRRSSLAWSIGGLLLVFALLAQVTHYFRQDLVRRPQVGPLLKDVYSRIGWPLSPDWDLAAFELRQWGNGGTPEANGQLAVRASLTNRAAFAQPHPILRLELDDRFGDAIAVRDFDPADYLKNAEEASRLMGPGASAEAELLLVDPGRDAVGYQLDVCLRESATLLRCAREAG